MKLFKKFLPLSIVLILASLIIVPIFGPGFFPMHDDVQPTRVFEMAKSLKDGMFPVRWVADLGFGYGYPIFNFYSPLPYYVGALFTLLGFDALTAAKIMFGVAVAAAGIGMYLFIRSVLGELAAIAGATVYLFFPYFAVNIFARGAVGEFYAFAFLPYVFWGLSGIYYKAKENPIKWIAISSLAMAALIISHNLSAYMLSLACILFLIIAILSGKQKKLLAVHYVIVVGLSFLLSAFYTLPVLFEMKYTDVASQLGAGFKYSLNFVCPIQLWDSPWGFGGSVPGCLDGISYRLGKSNIVVAVFALIFSVYFFIIKKKKMYGALFSFSLALLLFSVLMTTSYSQFLWEIFPGISYIQFPWRFLNFAGLAMAILAAFFVFFIEKYHKMFAYIGAASVVIITLLFNQKLFAPQLYHERTISYYTDREQITFAISKMTSEYMSPGFVHPQIKAEVPSVPLEIKKGKGNITLQEDQTDMLKASILMETDGEIIVKKAYFPAWKLFVGRKETPLKRVGTGMTFALPKGKHDITVRFIQTPIEKIGNGLTVTGVFALIIGIIIGRKKKNYDKKST